jgi:hypothetical protein
MRIETIAIHFQRQLRRSNIDRLNKRPGTLLDSLRESMLGFFVRSAILLV